MRESINLVNNFKAEKVIFNCGKYNVLELELIKILKEKNILYYQNVKELNIDNNKLYDDENDNSNIIYTELDNYKFLFMVDAGVGVEEDILEKYNLNDIDVLKVGHHEVRQVLAKKIIEKINPKYSIISIGKNKMFQINIEL